MKILITVVIGLLVVGCGKKQSGNTNESSSTPTKPAKKKAVGPNNKLPEWGETGNGIFIDGKLRTLQRKSTVQKSWCGSRSKLPVPPNSPITVSLFSGDGNNMFTYIGLTTKDVNVESWTAKRPEQYCLYFAGGPRWSGVHDSQFGDRENTSDWRSGIVPTIKSGDKLTIIYEKEKGTIIFRRDKKVVYKGIGFKGDLYLSGSIRYPNERITLEAPIKEK